MNIKWNKAIATARAATSRDGIPRAVVKYQGEYIPMTLASARKNGLRVYYRIPAPLDTKTEKGDR